MSELASYKRFMIHFGQDKELLCLLQFEEYMKELYNKTLTAEERQEIYNFAKGIK